MSDQSVFTNQEATRRPKNGRKNPEKKKEATRRPKNGRKNPEKKKEATRRPKNGRKKPEKSKGPGNHSLLLQDVFDIIMPAFKLWFTLVFDEKQMIVYGEHRVTRAVLRTVELCTICVYKNLSDKNDVLLYLDYLDYGKYTHVFYGPCIWALCDVGKTGGGDAEGAVFLLCYRLKDDTHFFAYALIELSEKVYRRRSSKIVSHTKPKVKSITVDPGKVSKIVEEMKMAAPLRNRASGSTPEKRRRTMEKEDDGEGTHPETETKDSKEHGSTCFGPDDHGATKPEPSSNEPPQAEPEASPQHSSEYKPFVGPNGTETETEDSKADKEHGSTYFLGSPDDRIGVNTEFGNDPTAYPSTSLFP